MRRISKILTNNLKKDLRSLILKHISKRKIFKSFLKLMITAVNFLLKISKIFRWIAEKLSTQTIAIQKWWLRVKKVRKNLPRNRNHNTLVQDKLQWQDPKFDKILIISFLLLTYICKLIFRVSFNSQWLKINLYVKIFQKSSFLVNFKVWIKIWEIFLRKKAQWYSKASISTSLQDFPLSMIKSIQSSLQFESEINAQ